MKHLIFPNASKCHFGKCAINHRYMQMHIKNKTRSCFTVQWNYGITEPDSFVKSCSTWCCMGQDGRLCVYINLHRHRIIHVPSFMAGLSWLVHACLHSPWVPKTWHNWNNHFSMNIIWVPGERNHINLLSPQTEFIIDSYLTGNVQNLPSQYKMATNRYTFPNSFSQ